MRKFLSNISIKWIMPPLLVIPVLVVATVLTFLAYTTGKHTADDLADQNMRQIHQRIEEHLTQLLDMPAAINKLNRRMLATGELSLTDVDTNRVPVFEILNIFEAVSSVVIGKKTGQTMWVIRYPGETTYEYAIKRSPDANMEEYPLDDHGGIAGGRLSEYDFHPTLRPWYKAAIAADEPTWGEVYIWVRNGQGETLGIPYVEPYRDPDGEILGVINTELTLSDISAYLGRLQVGKTGKAFIIERDSNLVANSEAIDSMKDGLERLPAAQTPDPWIAEATRTLIARFGLPLELSQSQRLGIEVDGEPMRMVVSPYRNRLNLDWLIVTLVPDADFLAGVERNRARSTAFGIIAVVLMLGVGITTAILLMRPFLALVAQVQRVGDGHLDEQIHRNDNLEMKQLSSAINQMVADLQDRVRLRHDMGLAKRIQSGLLPTEPLDLAGYEIAGWSDPADETGGDFFDWLELPNGGALLTIADATGHGIGPALIVTACRAYLRASVQQPDQAIEQTMAQVNHLMAQDMEPGRFVTAAVGVLDSTAHQLRLFSAGHAPNIFYRAADDIVENWDADELPLGIAPFDESSIGRTIDFAPGDVLLLATDGFFEWVNEHNQQFGIKRLQAFLQKHNHLSATQMIESLHAEVLRFANGTKQMDDLTAIVIKRLEK